VSIDFAIWNSEVPLEDEEAGIIYHSLLESGSSNAVKSSPKIAELARELGSRWPVPAQGHEDEWPFAAPCDVTDSYLVVAIVHSRLWDVWPILGKLTQEYELVMYDPQQQLAILPRRLSQKRTRERAKKKRAEK
jgi:hypothetical protein